MNISNWKVFDKSGSLLNWVADPFIQLTFNSPAGKNAKGYLITDASGKIVSSKITNSGYFYDDPDQITLTYKYLYDDEIYTLSPAEASINLINVSVFNPTQTYTYGIGSLKLGNIDKTFGYPSATFAAAIFLKPVSVGLVETEHLYIFEELDNGDLIRPYDASDSILIFEFFGEEDEIAFFQVDEEKSEISWGDAAIFDVSLFSKNTPLQLNIGFRSEEEGVFERRMRIYHIVNDTAYVIGEVIVNAEAIGEDERFRTHIENFGLPDPVNIKQVLKETDINEDLPDWKILNYKSKHIILEHDKIMPYVGTYKGLINAIKWLGYDDVYIREWFLNVKENKKISFVVPYDAKDRLQTILMFDSNQRKTLKKLNQLSLNYCINRETEETDIWGTPITENCYSYNIKEVFVKLLGLKNWLEKNIIGVNCRIVDITGEGIYIERFRNLSYNISGIGFNYNAEQKLTPYAIDKSSELIEGKADIKASLLELTKLKISDIPYKFEDFAKYAWNPLEPSRYFSMNDPSFLENSSDYLIVGAPLSYPLVNVNDVLYRLSTEKDFAGVIGSTLVSNPLFVLENDIRFYNTFDTSSIFFDTSTSLTIYIEKGYLRDASVDEWDKSISYSFYSDPCSNGYIMEASSGVIYKFYDYPSLNPNTNSLLQYAIDDNYKVPLFGVKNYKTMDSSGVNYLFDKLYYLDIIDGKIEMNAGIIDPTNSSDNLTIYLNFDYDTSLNEQMITVNPVYTSPRMRLYQIDPSVYYWSDPSGRTGNNNSSFILIDNSIYKMSVNHIGNYNIEVFAWDDYNTMFYGIANEPYSVWIKSPTIYTLIDDKCNVVCSSTFIDINDVSIIISNNNKPIYDRYISLQGLTFNIDSQGKPYVSIPSITYFQDVPEKNSINKFYNLTERVTNINGNIITIDPDYQKFYINDDIKLVKFDKRNYDLIVEASSHIVNVSGYNLTLDNIPSSIYFDTSSDIYIINDTYRSIVNYSNIDNKFVADVSGYQFEVGQLVGVIATDLSNGYSWGSSYRVLQVNGSTHTFDYPIPNYFLSNPLKYSIKVKHAFSSYSDIILLTEDAKEENNNFKIYLKDSNCQEYYLDNTFAYINILFDHNKVNSQWYDVSDNLINSEFYYYTKPIVVDASTLVILRSIYDPSTYLTDQKNIWTVTDHFNDSILFKVYNDSVPYIFDTPGTYDVECISYDIFGNAITKKYEGLIKVM